MSLPSVLFSTLREISDKNTSIVNRLYLYVMEYSEMFSADCVSGPERRWIVSRRLSGEVRATRDPVDDPRLNRPLDRPLDRVWIATRSATLTPTTLRY